VQTIYWVSGFMEVRIGLKPFFSVFRTKYPCFLNAETKAKRSLPFGVDS
jgi:hypothetical protein